MLQRERQLFDFRNQQETMIKQLAQDKKELADKLKHVSDALSTAKSMITINKSMQYIQLSCIFFCIKL